TAPWRAARSLRVHVFGKPIGRQFMTETALLRLAVDQRVSGRELIAEPDIVDEVSDVSIRLAAFALAYDQLRQGWKSGEIDFPRKLPPRPSTFSSITTSLAATCSGVGSLQ